MNNSGSKYARLRSHINTNDNPLGKYESQLILDANVDEHFVAT